MICDSFLNTIWFVSHALEIMKINILTCKPIQKALQVTSVIKWKMIEKLRYYLTFCAKSFRFDLF